jgi:hypothetical protein
MNGARPIRQRMVAWGTEALPLLAAALLATLAHQQAAGRGEWSHFLTQLGIIMVACLPLLIAHIAASRLADIRGVVVWLAGFVLLPLVLAWAQVDGYPLAPWQWIIAAAFSLVSLVARTARPGRMLLALGRLPITLDGAITAFVAVFVLTSSSMFASVDDAVNNQPFTVWFDPVHIAVHPLASLGYLAQFAFLGALILGFYGCCRSVLIRRVLRNHGWVAFLLASLMFWILYSPLAASLALLLPLNPLHWSVLPSENHNPFDPLNYAFSAAGWAIFTPLILMSERLVAERRAAMGRHEQAQAELHMLHQQINPHFLFNALNTLYALCLNDRAASAEAIVKLSDLLRYVVYQGGRDRVGLDEEIAYLRNYLDLQMLRFGQRCRIACHWPDNPARFGIPPLLLIMLVENAFKHGVEPCESEGMIDIALTLDGARMHFTCRNEPYDPVSGKSGDGVGLANLRRRLEILFGDDFKLSSAPDGHGWKAALSLDLRPC